MWPRQTYYFGCLTYNNGYVSNARYQSASIQEKRKKKKAYPESICAVGGPAWPARGRLSVT